MKQKDKNKTNFMSNIENIIFGIMIVSSISSLFLIILRTIKLIFGNIDILLVNIKYGVIIAIVSFVVLLFISVFKEQDDKKKVENLEDDEDYDKDTDDLLWLFFIGFIILMISLFILSIYNPNICKELSHFIFTPLGLLMLSITFLLQLAYMN